MGIDVVAEIQRYNQGRDPERLALKYRALADNPFSFLRGTCHLFYRRLAQHELLDGAPAAWICGDLHIENFGSYKGDNRLVYFDMNDFDEAILAPCTLDMVRLLASILVAAPTLGIAEGDARSLCRAALASYVRTVASGKPRWIDRDGAEGLISELLEAARSRKRKDYIDSRTVMAGDQRRLRIDNGKALRATPEQRAKVEAWLAAYAERQSEPAFFRLVDVARRVAGTGSLGVERYILLVAGKGNGNGSGHYLLDLKATAPSCLSGRVTLQQPAWESEAARVVSVQNWVQAVPAAFLEEVEMGGRPFVLKELLPSQDRVDLRGAARHTKRLGRLLTDFADIAAWGQLRAAGRCGAAGVETLMDFARDVALGRLLGIASDMADQVTADWKCFRDAQADGLDPASSDPHQ